MLQQHGCGDVGGRINDELSGNTNRKRGPLAHRALDAKGTTDRVDQPSTDRQAQPCSLRTVTLRIIDLVKLVEDVRKMVFLDSNAGITDVDLDSLRGSHALDFDLSLQCEFHRVLDQVAENSSKFHSIGTQPD